MRRESLLYDEEQHDYEELHEDRGEEPLHEDRGLLEVEQPEEGAPQCEHLGEGGAHLGIGEVAEVGILGLEEPGDLAEQVGGGGIIAEIWRSRKIAEFGLRITDWRSGLRRCGGNGLRG